MNEVLPLWKTVWWFLKKKLPYDPAIPLLGIYHEEIKTEKNTSIPLFIATLFTIAGTWKQPRCPSTDICWIKKIVVHIHSGIFSSVQFSPSVVSNSLWPHELLHTRPPCPSPTPGAYTSHVHWASDAIQPSHPLSSPSPPAPNPSQHQSLFQWVNSLHEVAKVLEFQL